MPVKFEYTAFNSSIYDLAAVDELIHQADDYYYYDEINQKTIVKIDSNFYLNLKSKYELDKLLNRTIQVSTDDFFIIDKVNVLNSGRYYCVYSSKLNNQEYFLYSHLYLVYNGKF